MTIHWINAVSNPPELNVLVLVYTHNGFATGKLTKDGWKYFDGYSETPDENGCLEKFKLEGWPAEYWARLTKP